MNMGGHMRGFSVIEVLVAMGIFLIIAVGGVTLFLQTFTTGRLEAEQTNAKQLAQEGIEAARSIGRQDWSNLVAGAHGLTNGSGFWEFSGTSETIGKYTRSVAVSDVRRECAQGTGDIVETGGLSDPDTFKIATSVDWNVTPTRANSTTFETYLTNSSGVVVGDWSPPNEIATLNLSGNDDGLKIQVQGDYAYLIRSSSPQFWVIDISNPASPSVVTSLSLNGNSLNLFVQGDYAYVASSDNSQELQIIDISTPSSPTQVGSYNAPGNADMFGVYVVGDYAYLSRDSSADAEFYVVDVSTPSSPTLAGSLELGDDANNVYVRPQADLAYVATDANAAELRIITVSTPSSPTLTGTFNAGGNQNAESVIGFCDTAIFGRDNGDIYIIDTSTPSSPTQTSTFSASSFVSDLAIFHKNRYLLAATGDNNNELKAIDISTLASPSLLGSMSGGDDLNGVAYSLDQDRAYVVGDDNSQEFIVAGPAP